MTDPAAARAFLENEVAGLEPFDFLVVVPSSQPAHVVELTRREDGALEVRIPGRPAPIPELPVEVRSRLRDRQFASEDPANQLREWKRGVADAAEAVKVVQELLVEVFGEKPDAPIDLSHGSHRAEYEAREKLAKARKRIEGVVTEMLGKPAERDADGDYVMPMGDVHVTVAPRVALDGQVVLRVFAITNVAVSVTPELGLFLARLNFGLLFGRFALDVEHRSIWFDETLMGDQFREEELRFAIRMVASTADGWDDRLKQMFGGVTYQEVLSGMTAETPPPTKPGGNVGLYL